MMTYSGSNVLRSTPMPLLGRSRTCPIDAFTMKPSPRYLLIVLAFAGDSTITRFLPFFLAMSQSASTGPSLQTHERDGNVARIDRGASNLNDDAGCDISPDGHL